MISLKDELASNFRFRRIKTPTIIQMEVAECGAACLAIILAHYKKYIPLEELRVSCGITRDGSKANNIISAAEHYGLIAHGYSTTLPSLDDIELPAILFWNFEHFVVLEGFDKEVAYINDPAAGPRAVSYEDLDLCYSGVVLSFEKGPDFKPSGSPKKIIPTLLEKSKLILQPLVFIFLASMAAIIPGLAQPAISQVFMDQIIMENNLEWVWGIVFSMIAIIVVKSVLTFVLDNVLFKTQTRLSVILSTSSFWHLLCIPYVFFTVRNPGEISYRLNANDSISSSVSTKIVPTVISSILVVVYGAAIIYYDLTMAIAGFAIIALDMWTLQRVYRVKTDAYASYQSNSGKFNSYALGLLGNIGSVKEMGMEYKLFSTLSGHYTKMRNSELTMIQKNIILEVVPGFLQALSGIIVLGIGCWKVMNGTFSVGMLFAVQMLMSSLIGPATSLVGMAEMIQFLKIDIDRIDDINSFPAEPIPLQSKISHDMKKLEGNVSVQNLSFAYGPLSPKVLDGISFELAPGKSIALVGPTGSGKSTVAKLISGLYKPDSGEILFDGFSRENLARDLIHNSLAVVEQHPFLLKGTVKENITLLDTEIKEEDILKAVKDACLTPLIMSRKGGFEFEIEQGGSNISGGQKQCFEIARALTRNPTILILDEATSTLDSEIEVDIITHVRRRGIALLMVAHRLSTIKTCDEIIVLDKGKVVAKGTHAELREVPGIYQDLVQAELTQTGGALHEA